MYRLLIYEYFLFHIFNYFHHLSYQQAIFPNKDEITLLENQKQKYIDNHL